MLARPLGRRPQFPPLVAVIYLMGIEVKVESTGRLTLVAMLEPMGLGGVVVLRATVPIVDATDGTPTDVSAADVPPALRSDRVDAVDGTLWNTSPSALL